MASLSDEVPHQDVAALRDAEAEQIDKHDHVGTVGPGCQGLVANLIYKIGDNHLRQTVRDILAHGRDADIQQVLQFLPRHGTEIVQRELWDMLPEMDNRQQHHCNGTTGSRGNGSTLDTQLRTAPMAEDKGIVAEDVQHIDNTCHHHRIDHLVGTTQRGRERQR